MAAASAAAILASCSAGGQKVVVTNDTDLARENETVELCFKGLQNADAALTEENVVVLDQAGNQVPSQVYAEADGKVKLLFQATVPANAAVKYAVKAGEREAYPVKAYSRHVPERMDDYAYENNVVAGRIYGPALEFPRTFGSDIWLKCTERLVIDDWFKKMDYHHNYGEGMDCYKVGGTLGGGALVPYSDGKDFVIGDNWASFQHICDGPVRTKATFTYNAFDVNGKKYSASRELVLDANSRFVKSVTAFFPVEHESDSLDVVLGAIQHEVLNRENGENWIAFTEVASDTKHHTTRSPHRGSCSPGAPGSSVLFSVSCPGPDPARHCLQNLLRPWNCSDSVLSEMVATRQVAATEHVKWGYYDWRDRIF